MGMGEEEGKRGGGEEAGREETGGKREGGGKTVSEERGIG